MFFCKTPKSIGETSGVHVGFVAQEVETVFPDWVIDTPSGYKALSIKGATALIVEALRELKAEEDEKTESLRQTNQELSTRVQQLERVVKRLPANKEARQ